MYILCRAYWEISLSLQDLVTIYDSQTLYVDDLETSLHFELAYSLSLSIRQLYNSMGGGERELHQIFGNWVQHTIKNWTQSDVTFCKNEGSKRSKINKKFRLNLGLRISGTKCDRDKLTFSAERGVHHITMRYKLGTQSD